MALMYMVSDNLKVVYVFNWKATGTDNVLLLYFLRALYQYPQYSPCLILYYNIIFIKE